MAKLVVFLPDGAALDVPLRRERTMIGRRAGNDVVLPNLAVSGEHAVVVTILADSFLEDLNSTNGTRVNGDPIAKHFLRDRDEIEIGRHKLIYCVDEDAKPASKMLEGMARVQERDFGGRVETAKPFVRWQGAENDQASAERSSIPSTDVPGGATGKGSRPSGRERSSAARPGALGRSQVDALIEPPEAPAEETQPPVQIPAAPLSGPGVRVLTGARAGMEAPLSKTETTIGRPGVQVAAIVRVDGRFRLKPVEGISPPALNGQPVGADGAFLAPGDVAEVAGTQIEFVDPTAEAAPIAGDQAQAPGSAAPSKGDQA